MPHPITTDLTPIEGTHLHRRFQRGREVAPEYRGPDYQADVKAQEEADVKGYKSVVARGSLFMKMHGEWYIWNGGGL